MFLHLSVSHSVYKGGHAWQRGMHGRGACVAAGRACMAGGLCGKGTCMVRAGMCGRGVCVCWGCAW